MTNKTTETPEGRYELLRQAADSLQARLVREGVGGTALTFAACLRFAELAMATINERPSPRAQFDALVDRAESEAHSYYASTDHRALLLKRARRREHIMRLCAELGERGVRVSERYNTAKKTWVRFDHRDVCASIDTDVRLKVTDGVRETEVRWVINRDTGAITVTGGKACDSELRDALILATEQYQDHAEA